MKKKKITALLLVIVFSFLCGCSSPVSGISSENTQVSKDIFAMDTTMTVTAYGENAQEAVDAAIDEIKRLDALLSTGSGTSEISILNAAGSSKLSDDAAYLVKRSIELNASTSGAFDIAIYPVMKAWGFADGNYQVPESSELQRLLTLADVSDIIYNDSTKEISFAQSGMQIDLGGIAKGYTSARIMEIFKEHGVSHGMVSLGGNVQVLGTKTDGSKWRIAVQNPDKSSDYLGVLSVSDKAVITSGGYERYFEQDGVTYHHIIDPATGYPADNGLVSVTIVSSDGTLADGLSTSLFIMGKDKAIEYWRAHHDEFDVIMLTDDGELYVTENIYSDFTTDRKVKKITINE
jgi:thiamine biosynthesis lipoprotein